MQLYANVHDLLTSQRKAGGAGSAGRPYYKEDATYLYSFIRVKFTSKVSSLMDVATVATDAADLAEHYASIFATHSLPVKVIDNLFAFFNRFVVPVERHGFERGEFVRIRRLYLLILCDALEKNGLGGTKGAVGAVLQTWPQFKVTDWMRDLIEAPCRANVDFAKRNALCFLLIGADPGATYDAMLAAVLNDNSQLEADQESTHALAEWQRNGNQHIFANFREVALFTKHSHLSLMHFRDWTTVSHAWCTPSAKLTALTVLLVAETYTRELLPRMPMDCWYRILNMIPRHELRVGACIQSEEDAALAVYTKTLNAGKAGGGAKLPALH